MSAQAIEMVQNMILDTIQPFVARLSAVEASVSTVLAVNSAEAALSHEQAQEGVQTPEKPLNGSTVLPGVVEEILALHRLDATPQQWIFQGGKQQQAPEGMWEITCAVCSNHKIDWREGDPEPPRCKTVQILLRGV